MITTDTTWEELYEGAILKACDTPDSIWLTTAELQEVGGDHAMVEAGWILAVSVRDQHVFRPLRGGRRRRHEAKRWLFEKLARIPSTEGLEPE